MQTKSKNRELATLSFVQSPSNLLGLKVGNKVKLKNSSLSYYIVTELKKGKAILDFWKDPVSEGDLTPYIEPEVLPNPLGFMVGDRVASSDPNSLAYCWKGIIISMYSDCPGACWVEYLERCSELKMKETRITARLSQLRRLEVV